MSSSLGAVFSSCSPDFGERGVLDRFGQIGPKVFVTCDGYWYSGKPIDISAKVVAVAEKLSPEATVIVPYLDPARAASLVGEVANGTAFTDIMARSESKPTFRPMPFNAPLYILFSSGTTGCRNASSTAPAAR